MDGDPAVHDLPAPVVAALVANHRAFAKYLERRVGDRALAEDILQDAFIKLVERPERAPADEGIVPWFDRTLRNAAIDRFRRRGAVQRVINAFACEMETRQNPTPEMEAEICACVTRLAEQHLLSASNAGVRVFRAREALKKRVVESCGTCAEHGCMNCTCRSH